jgi:hypothetical protein
VEGADEGVPDNVQTDGDQGNLMLYYDLIHFSQSHCSQKLNI